jgi:glycerophosphoryl diester phosphodiesterase
MIELDVHQTLDRHLVVIHDETVDRTTDGTGRISSLTLEEVMGLNAAARYPGMTEAVPTFSEVLKRYSKKVPLSIEVKHGSSVYPGIEGAVVEELKENDALQEVELISFDLDCLRRLRNASREVKLGFIFIGNISVFTEMVGTEVDAMHAAWNFLTRDGVRYASGKGLATYAWTVNTERDAAAALRLETDGLVTNYPDMVISLVGNGSWQLTGNM